MSNDPVGRRPLATDHQSTLRLVALAAVSLGVVLLAAAAFVLSYEGIHHIALRAGVSPELAKLYPLIFDVMLVVAGAAALALRGAGWWARLYAWGSLLVLLAAMAVGNAVYASGTTLPTQPTKIAVAIIPWVLPLMAFGLLLEMLRHFRTTRSSAAMAAAGAAASGAAVAGTVVGTDVNGGSQTPATLAAVSGGKARELPRVDLDTLLGPKAGEPPAVTILHGIGTDQNDGHQVDPVSYGEETGYVHPDSYLDEGEYSPHGDTGGPGIPDELAGHTDGNGTHLAGHGAIPAEAATAPAAVAPTAAEQAVTQAGSPANSAGPATSAEPTANPGAASETSTEPLFTPKAAPATAAEDTVTRAESPANSAAASAEPSGNPGASSQTSAEPLFTPAADPATSAESPATPAADPASSTETQTTPAEPATAAAEPSAPTAETPAPSPVATVASAGAPAGEAASGTGNGLAAGGGLADAKTAAGQDGVAGADQDGAGVEQEAVVAEGPALERIRSTPTRPEE
jgi:Protein of unknown function (DUF2637)